ncbi:cobyrinate a,c-diamide synthase [Algicella marina]|uniref:Cobyrinate a,c-diamide synthase n=1 Tax=Algicella marina TaxID=2683284 RepID=A0A6P1SZ30_9RHOB|nr:cobyrinate a,c-diamide synthase [Algicella marina]QHQ35728.1 cobyrinate a,c-diamide synthase [Algicella marina]
MPPRALVIAAPRSGAGKTTLTLALLRALRNRGIRVAGAKSGPDYIDPAFHAAASGTPAFNLDAWAMDSASLHARAANMEAELLLIEGAMGALDGAGVAGNGSAADLAATLGLPVLWVQDLRNLAHSAALPAAGFQALRPDIPIAGIILNTARSPRHAAMAEAGLASAGLPHVGTVTETSALHLPDRHLGLVQAAEHPALDSFLNAAADHIDRCCNLDAIANAAQPLSPAGAPLRLPPLGQRIAIARDDAFAFAYPHLLADWQAQGASLHPFSPLADEGPDTAADAIFLPGGYPELQAGKLAAAARFRSSMRASTALIYGECGGYMTLGTGLVDADGTRHQMLGLLPVETSFETRRLHLGYRRLRPLSGPFATPLTAHEFHYATVLSEGDGIALFAAEDADGATLPPMGRSVGNVAGSFAHVIGPAG